MVDIKTAVRNATAFATESLGAERTADIRLEEVESSNVDGRPVWLITLSSWTLKASMSALAIAMGADLDREYKIFTVAKDDGEVISMKIRLFEIPVAK